MLQIKNVTKQFGSKIAVDNLSLDIHEGEIFGLLGPNGAGKSTTLKMITGLLEIDKGDILIDNFSIINNSNEAKKLFGFVSDSPDAFLNLKATEYLSFITSVYNLNIEDTEMEITRLSKDLEIYENLSDLISSFSHGMRQKIFIIGALIHKPKYLILDEPMTGLDPNSSKYLKEIMKDYANKGNCVIYSTHILDVAEKVCTRVGIIDKGNLVYSDTIEGISKKKSKDANLESLFIQLTK